MPYSIRTQDGIVINNIPDDVPKDSDILRQRVADARAQRQQAEKPSQQQIFESERQRIQQENIDAMPWYERAAVGVGRGFTNVGRGLGLVDQADESEQRAYQQLADQSRAATIGEIVGEAAPFLAPGAGVGGLLTRGGVGLAGRVGAQAALGALEGGVIARGRGGSDEDIVQGAGIGGTIAGGVEAVLPIVGRMGRALLGRLGQKVDGPLIDAAGRPTVKFQAALKQSGVNFDDLLDDAKAAVADLGNVDPEQAARYALFRSVDEGFVPTKAQLTRSASDFQAQQELAKTSTRTRAALEAQDELLARRVEREIAETGGAEGAKGGSVFSAITERSDELTSQINDLYRSARERVGREKIVKPIALGAKLRELAPLNTKSGGTVEAVVGELKNRGILDKDMRVVGRVDVESMETIRQAVNDLYDPTNPFANRVVRELKDALDDDVFKQSGEDIFRNARAAKAAYEKELTTAGLSKFDRRGVNVVRDILENAANPDDIVKSVVFAQGYRGQDVGALRKYLEGFDSGKQALSDLRASTLAEIRDRMLIGAPGQTGVREISSNKLRSTLKQIGDAKLAALFDEKEVKFLNNLLKVAEARAPVSGTQQGLGPSAQAVIKAAVPERIANVFGEISANRKGRLIISATPEKLPIKSIVGPAEARAAGVAATALAAKPKKEERK